MLTQLSPIGFGDAQWLGWAMFGLRLAACAAAVTAGTIALALGRGSRGRALAAAAFFVCLPLACVGGAVESVLRLQTVSALAWTLGLYLGGTAGLAVARREGRSGVVDIYAMMFATGDAAVAIALGTGPAVGLQRHVELFSHGATWVVAATSVIGAVLDLAVILRGGAFGPQRGIRGLWRTGGALAICVLCTAGGSLAAV